ncbi:transglutaminase family protein [Piscinibacter koreensis]|uniref:Transglutaminase family protein n=1 Tax=Piscinibacter koreensis TaxID=2742824 RepID=A0A7Y6TVD9_9BURK|nr:transglutaminase family protein [Schlegelella koreensis]NUZ05014.1 transglutaminase family protein [Schlegelella koreensis]
MAAEHYSVEHETRYAYPAPVAQSWQLAHLTPRGLPWQRLLAHELAIEPGPSSCRSGLDSFGNVATHFSLHGAHRLLRVRMTCEVEVGLRPDARDAPGKALGWEAVRDTVRRDPSLDDLGAARMVEPTRLVPWSAAARDYACESFVAGRGWLEATTELMHRIRDEFTFDPEATTVTTQVDEVLEHRRGVCQDFAHLMIACLRGLGLPARYVSGYLLTQPPEGRPRLLGADATHAWVAAYSPVHGWVEFDPTNDTLADQRYITLAWGTDFEDVVPLRGVIVGGRRQAMSVEVTVIPASERAGA